MDQSIALIFMIFCIFAPMLLSFFTIESKEKIVYVKQEVVKYKYIAKEKEPENKVLKPNKELVEDCINCLISLGMSKSYSKKRVEDLFNKNTYNSVEEFLMDAYKIT